VNFPSIIERERPFTPKERGVQAFYIREFKRLANQG
jgi:hypothetical protein